MSYSLEMNLDRERSDVKDLDRVLRGTPEAVVDGEHSCHGRHDTPDRYALRIIDIPRSICTHESSLLLW